MSLSLCDFSSSLDFSCDLCPLMVQPHHVICVLYRTCTTSLVMWLISTRGFMSLALSCDLYLLEDLCHWPRRVTCILLDDLCHWPLHVRIYVTGLIVWLVSIGGFMSLASSCHQHRQLLALLWKVMTWIILLLNCFRVKQEFVNNYKWLYPYWWYLFRCLTFQGRGNLS